jgi:V8-like Glu-specific endopeptidase
VRSRNRFGESIDSICGTADESQEVEQYDGSFGISKEFVALHQKKVGQVQWNDNLNSIYDDPGNLSGRRWMSGTLLANDYFLTAGHCFDSASLSADEFLPKVNGMNKRIEPDEVAKNMHVNFNYQTDPEGNLRQEDPFPVIELCEFRCMYVDYAIARLGKNNKDERPGHKYGYARVSNKDANLNETVCIIGHPKDARGNTTKKIAGGRISLVKDCPIFHKCYIGYNAIDTSSGSSGSGILRYPDGEMVGIHVIGECERDRGFNYGLKASTLMQGSHILKNL